MIAFLPATSDAATMCSPSADKAGLDRKGRAPKASTGILASGAGAGAAAASAAVSSAAPTRTLRRSPLMLPPSKSRSAPAGDLRSGRRPVVVARDIGRVPAREPLVRLVEPLGGDILIREVVGALLLLDVAEVGALMLA